MTKKRGRKPKNRRFDLIPSNLVKQCIVCGKRKFADKFYKCAKNKDNLRNSCITCVKQYNKIWREENRLAIQMEN